MAFSPLGVLKNSLDNIQEYISRLAWISEARGPANNIRATITDGSVTVPAVTTVGTVTGQTNIGGYAANNQIPALQNMEAVMSNIQNITRP